MICESNSRGKLTATTTREAGNALWLVALALHAYQLEHKAFPATLGELAPDYLKQIPADPFGGGEPLRYRRAGTSYLLWSVGPDSIDNNGKAIPPGSRAATSQKRGLPRIATDSRGDYVWGKNR